MSSSSDVLFSEAGNVGLVTMNRPRALNSLTLGMVRAMYGKLEEWRLKDSVKLVLLEGSGEKAFCAGGDIRYASLLSGFLFALQGLPSHS